MQSLVIIYFTAVYASIARSEHRVRRALGESMRQRLAPVPIRLYTVCWLWQRSERAAQCDVNLLSQREFRRVPS